MTIDKRRLTAAYKKRESVAGIYAFRSTSGECWVGHARDVDKIGNRLAFTLKTGAMRNASLQTAWDRDGADAFTLDLLDLLDEEALGLDPQKSLMVRAAVWREKLGAQAV